MTPRLPRTAAKLARPAVGALTLVGTASVLSGCMYLSPAQTTVSYDPADGTSATIGSIQLQDVAIVSSAKGASGSMIGMATNNSTSAVQLTVTPTGGAAETVTIPGSTAVRLDGQTSGDSSQTVGPVEVAKVTAIPGGVMAVSFQTAGGGQNTVQVPVLLDQPPYGSASPSHPTYTPPSTSAVSEPPA